MSPRCVWLVVALSAWCSQLCVTCGTANYGDTATPCSKWGFCWETYQPQCLQHLYPYLHGQMHSHTCMDIDIYIYIYTHQEWLVRPQKCKAPPIYNFISTNIQNHYWMLEYCCQHIVDSHCIQSVQLALLQIIKQSIACHLRDCQLRWHGDTM